MENSIHLTIANNFVSSIINDEERLTHSEIDNIEIMINDEADEAIEEFFDSLQIEIKIIYNR